MKDHDITPAEFPKENSCQPNHADRYTTCSQHIKSFRIAGVHFWHWPPTSTAGIQCATLNDMHFNAGLPLSGVGVHTVADRARALAGLIVTVVVAPHPAANSSRLPDLLLLGGTVAHHVLRLPEVLGVGTAGRRRQLSPVLRVDTVALGARTLLGLVVTIGVAVWVAATRGKSAVVISIVIVPQDISPAESLVKCRTGHRCHQQRQTEQ